MAEREHFTNGRCFTFGSGLTIVGAVFGVQVSGWTHWIFIGFSYGVGSVLMLIATILIANSYFSKQSENAVASPPQALGVFPGIPTLSALLGQNTSVDFNAKQFFAQAHYSPVTAEIEKNIKTVAQQYAPNDKEAFYARFIGVGLVAYQHELSALLIYGSQRRALEEMNSRGIIPISDIKKHYDKAAIDFPNAYESYSFDQWLVFLKSRMLIAVYPSQMVELSYNGKDFLKYLAHVGQNITDKPY